MSERFFDETKKKQLCTILGVGGTFDMAREYLGCSLRTIQREMERDEKFAQEVREAAMNAEVKCLETIQKAQTDKNTFWRPATWLLERLHPKRYEKAKRDLIPMNAFPEAMISACDMAISCMAPEDIRKQLEPKIDEFIQEELAKRTIDGDEDGIAVIKEMINLLQVVKQCEGKHLDGNPCYGGSLPQN
jgi:hypothetical protein